MNHELHDRLAAVLERPHRLGMIGGELEEQLAHCASFSRVLGALDPGEGAQACDLGTGGGLPGVALAAAFPLLRWTMIEIRVSRATEVERALGRLGLDATVATKPAQTLGHDDGYREQVDVVVARSFGPPALTAESAAGLLRVGGHLIVSEPPSAVADRPERWPDTGLTRLGMDGMRLVVDEGHHFGVIRKRAPVEPHVPRLPPKATRGWLQ